MFQASPDLDQSQLGRAGKRQAATLVEIQHASANAKERGGDRWREVPIRMLVGCVGMVRFDGSHHLQQRCFVLTHVCVTRLLNHEIFSCRQRQEAHQFIQHWQSDLDVMCLILRPHRAATTLLDLIRREPLPNASEKQLCAIGEMRQLSVLGRMVCAHLNAPLRLLKV